MIDINKRIIDLSVGDMIEILELFTEKTKQQSKVSIDTTKNNNNNHFVYGLLGLAHLFGCSKSTASRIKKSGKISAAITQIGNLIIVDTEKAIELAGKVNGKHNKK
jgi:predicted RNase H-related nuclease YkuK (DUF458 family)